MSMMKLTLARSQPVQNRPVKVLVFGEMGKCGELLLSFTEWIQLNKTIKEGIESLERKSELKMEVKVQGLEEKAPAPSPASAPNLRETWAPTKIPTEAEVAQALQALEKETEGI
jgi:hypothetical protein